MAKSQQEINYENALEAKNDAQEALAQANTELKDAQDNLGLAQSEMTKYKAVSVCGLNFYTSVGDSTNYTSPSSFECIIIKKAYNDGLYADGATAKSALDYANSDLTTKTNKAQQAKANYESASVAASNAYKDWLDWKKSNMTPEEVEAFNELESEKDATKLRMDAWKWAGIGFGVLLFVFGVWWLIKRFRG